MDVTRDSLRSLGREVNRAVRAARDPEGYREAEEAARRFEEALRQYDERCLEIVYNDAGKGGARDSLRFLARKANRPDKELLHHLISDLPYPYRIPPVRSRLAEIGRMEKFAATLRDVAKKVRDDPECGLHAGMLSGSHSPRGSQGFVATNERPIWVLDPELDSLPMMLERCAGLLEGRARLLRQHAKREPTENQYWKDRADEVVAKVKQATGRCHRERVAAILRVLHPSIAVEAESLRKRAYRQMKSHPA